MTDTIQLVTEGGIAATHAEVEDFRPLVGPSTGGEFNTIKAALVPVACFRVDNIRFKFDSSFIQPGIEAELKHLAELLKKHPPASIAKTATPPEMVGCPLSIFGHADPVGDDEYNKQLSGRRAAAVYGLLTRDVELWDELFKNPIGNDKWGKESIQTMVIETTVPKPTEEPDVSNIENNPSQRKALYLSYMDKLCEQVDEEGKPKQDKAGKPETLKLEKTDFLAQGQDKNGKGDYQGCGEFNPILLFSQEEEKAFQQDKDKTKRNQANEPNRRVMVLIFRKGTKVDPNRWPCPRAKEGTAGCKKRFWSDGEKRRTTRRQIDLRVFNETKDTFACRFYQRLITGSPCEKVHGRVSWITEIPEGLDEDIFLLIHDESGKEIFRLKPDQSRSGPEHNRTFDLSRLDANVPFRLELHAGEKFIAPIVNLVINVLRIGLDLSDDAAAGAGLFVAEPLADPSDPLDDNQQIDLSSEVSCPPNALPLNESA